MKLRARDTYVFGDKGFQLQILDNDMSFENRIEIARLFAAAPEMLDALEHCLAFFESKGLIDDRDSSPWNDAKEAINKAKGCK